MTENIDNLDDKFIVINKKHLDQLSNKLRIGIRYKLEEILCHLPENKYIVCNQDEPYAEEIAKIILDNETKYPEANCEK